MTLNGSAYPKFGVNTICPDFNTHDPRTVEQLQWGGGMDVFVDRLDEWLSTQQQWKSPDRIVVAHSFGGMLAQKWLLRHRGSDSGAIKGLVLIGTTAGPMYDVLRPIALRIGRYAPRVSVSFAMELWSAPWILRGGKRLVGRGPTKTVDFSEIEPATDFRIGLAGWRNTDWQAVLAYRMGMKGFDVRGDLNEISVPTIVLHGSNDTVLPSEVGRALAEGLPNAKFKIVSSAPHVLPLTHPKAITEAVTRLLL
jgi:pimeloyl-ACP methyl ester carboxylesterase